MTTIRYELRPKKIDGSIPVFITVTHRSVRKRMNTKICIEKSEYSKAGKILSFEKKREIEELLNRYRRIIDRIEKERIGQKYDVNFIVEKLTEEADGSDIDFFRFSNRWLDQSPIKDKNNYRTMLRSLKAFLGKESLPINNINYSLLKDYEVSLGNKERAKSLYLGSIRHLYREALRRYNTDEVTVIKNDPFTRYQVPRQRLNVGGKRALSLEEIKKIIDFESERPGSREQQARDCFILSFCLMGMNSADMFTALKPTKGVVRYQRMKTKSRREDGAYIEVTIQPQVKALVKKYSDKERLFWFYRRYSTYQCFNQNINIGLKEVGEKLGIHNLQFYQARHTFATLSRNLMKFSKSDVDEALNHVGEHSIADVYIRKDFSIINENNRLLLEKVFE